MPANYFKYDVAISFLFEDLSLAQALNDKLSEGLAVFFFPGKQEVLAGTDGLETMRAPFVHQSRVNVVLYRQKWGNTPWTAVESAAVKDSCLANAYRNLFFFVVEPTDVLPTWLPDTHVRFNYGVFSLDEAVGAIKARVQERGGHFTPLTPMKKAQLLKAEEEFKYDKERLKSGDGIRDVYASVTELDQEIKRHCDEVNAGGDMQIWCETTMNGHIPQGAVLTDGQVGLIAIWEQQNPYHLDNSGLFVREFNGRLRMSGESFQGYHMNPPKMIHETPYEPYLSRAREVGWNQRGQSKEFIASPALASKCVLEFMELVERSNKGEIDKRRR